MGRDIHLRLFKYDKDRNQFKRLILYKWNESKGQHEEVYIFVGRNYEMFEIMTDGYFPAESIVLNSLFDPDREEIEKEMGYNGTYDFKEINLAQLALYCERHQEILDYDADWSNEDSDPNFVEPKKANPVCSLFEDICKYAQFADDWDWDFEPLSNYKLIYFFDC